MASSSSRSNPPYRGVQLHAPSGKWCARIGVDFRNVHLGLFATAREAARTYDRAARAIHGDEARLNFPDERDLPPMHPDEIRARAGIVAVEKRSKYRGVGWSSSHQKWEVRLVADGKTIRVGRFAEEKEAALAYDRVALHALGSRAILNFPNGKTRPADATTIRKEQRARFKTRTTSRYRGVHRHASMDGWAARIRVAGLVHALGYYDSEEMAAIAHDRAAVYFHRDAAVRNFPRRALAPASPEELRREAAALTKEKTSSRYCGVVWSARRERWLAYVDLPERELLGEYDTEDEAARAHDRAVVALGTTSKRNFPKERVDPATPAELRAECRARFKATTSSPYRGVSWVRRKASWRVTLQVENRRFHLGEYEDEVDAARAYDRAALRHRGPGPLNFPAEIRPGASASTPARGGRRRKGRRGRSGRACLRA